MLKFSPWRRWRRCRRAARQQTYERWRDEVLHKLTFFFSSLRHIYTKYPPHRLPPFLQAEGQAFLEEDFHNLTALSALPLQDLEALFEAVQRECVTDKWRQGLTGIEHHMEVATLRADRQMDSHRKDGKRGMAPTPKTVGKRTIARAWREYGGHVVHTKE